MVNSANSGSHKIQSSHSNKGSLQNKDAQSSLKNQSSEKSGLTQNTTSGAGGQQQQEKVLITGDDILIEYVERLMNQLKIMGDEALLQDTWKRSIEKFITHYVWHSQDRRKVEGPMTSMIERLEGRLHEM